MTINVVNVIDREKVEQTHPLFENFRNQNIKFNNFIRLAEKKDDDYESKAMFLLYALLNLGDYDECANKHIGHALAAIKAGKSIVQAVDYLNVGTPNPSINFENIEDDERESSIDFYYLYFNQEAKMMSQINTWGKLMNVIDQIGIDKVIEIDSNISWGYAKEYFKIYHK